MSPKEDGSLTKTLAATFGGTDQKPADDEVSTQSDEDIPVETRKNRDLRADVRAAADERGTVVPQRVKRPNFFQRLFGPRQPKNQPQPAPMRGH
jgi:hypothetical protein